MPSTIVRAVRPITRGPFTFAGIVASILHGEHKPKSRAQYARCVASQDDGSPCGLPARYLDFKRGGHVCYEHKPNRKQEALTLV